MVKKKSQNCSPNWGQCTGQQHINQRNNGLPLLKSVISLGRNCWNNLGASPQAAGVVWPFLVRTSLSLLLPIMLSLHHANQKEKKKIKYRLSCHTSQNSSRTYRYHVLTAIKKQCHSAKTWSSSSIPEQRTNHVQYHKPVSAEFGVNTSKKNSKNLNIAMACANSVR